VACSAVAPAALAAATYTRERAAAGVLARFCAAARAESTSLSPLRFRQAVSDSLQLLAPTHHAVLDALGVLGKVCAGHAETVSSAALQMLGDAERPIACPYGGLTSGPALRRLCARAAQAHIAAVECLAAGCRAASCSQTHAPDVQAAQVALWCVEDLLGMAPRGAGLREGCWLAARYLPLLRVVYGPDDAAVTRCSAAVAAAVAAGKHGGAGAGAGAGKPAGGGGAWGGGGLGMGMGGGGGAKQEDELEAGQSADGRVTALSASQALRTCSPLAECTSPDPNWAAQETDVASSERAETPACGNPGCIYTWTPNMKKCGGCKLVSYCSAQCQKAAWKEHKAKCGAAR
jgi:hypothetical protein